MFQLLLTEINGLINAFLCQVVMTMMMKLPILTCAEKPEA